MLGKIRRNSKQLLEAKRTSVSAAGSTPSNPPQKPSSRESLTFFHLPAEIRNVIYEDVAREASISLPLTSSKNGKKATPSGKLGIGVGSIPSLLVVSRQARREYLPLLLEFAAVKVLIKDFDFRNLIRMVLSLYNTEQKSLRMNERLTIQLLAEKCNRDSIVALRRWLENRANGLDRLPWNYSVYWKAKHQIIPTSAEVKRFEAYQRRRDVLEQNLEVLAQLDKNIHENLQFELRPVIAAFEDEVRRNPLHRDSGMDMLSTVFRSNSNPMCSA